VVSENIIVIAACAVLAVSSIPAAPPASAVQGKFKNCAAFNKKYLTGIAFTQSAADLDFSQRLMMRPKAS